MGEFSPAQLQLLTDWFRRTRESQMVHNRCANHFSRLHLWLGIPSVALSTIVGTAVFASLERATSADVRIGVGLLSVLAAVFAGLQTFLGYAERANRHRAAGAGYGALRRSLEMLKTFPSADEAALVSTLGEVKKQMDELAGTAPEVPARIKDASDDFLQRNGYGKLFDLPGKAATARDG
jgi:hypothetical protein